jgi:capsular exopolysaccharide synthesis family protein
MTPHSSETPDPTPQQRSGPRQDAQTPNPIAGRIEPTTPTQPVRPLPPEPAPTGLTAPPDFKSLLRSLGRRWMLAAILSIVLGGLAGLGVWVLLTPDYTAFAQIRVDYVPITLVGHGEAVAQFGPYVKSQASIIKSRPIIQAALRKDEIRKLNLEKDIPDLASVLEDKILVDVKDTSELMTIQYSHRNEMVATAIVKALTDSYMDTVEYEKSTRLARDAEVEKAITDLQGEIKKKKSSIREKMRVAVGQVADPDAVKRQREEIGINVRDLHSQRYTIRNEIAKSESALKGQEYRLKALLAAKIDDTQVEMALKGDPTAGPLVGRIATAKAIIKYYEDSATQPQLEPSWKKAKRELALAETDLANRRAELRTEMIDKALTRGKEEIEFQKTILKDGLEAMNKQLVDLQKELTKQWEEADKLPSIQAMVETGELEREIFNHNLTLTALQTKLDENKINSRFADRIHLHQEAALMKKAATKQILASLAAPIVVAGAICFLLAYGDYRLRRVYSAQEVSGGLGIRVVGAVPPVPGLERRLVGTAGETDLEGHPVLESIDALRTTLLRESQRERRRVILVTSAGAGEGKTTLAASLAISLARAGRKTLLIDGDLRGPAVNQLFEVPLQPGFSEVVLNEVDAVDAIQPSTVDNLSILPAGQWDREVLASLARDGLEGVLEKLRDEYDFILIDSHPILSATDSLLLAQRVDGVLLAVLRGFSQMPRVYAAAQRLTSLGVKVLGAVMIASDPDEVVTSAPSQPVLAGAR